MSINENREGYVFGGDKYVFAHDRYVFAEFYEDQLKSALQGVLALSIAPFHGYFVGPTKAGEIAKITIRKIGIKFCESRLPKHCNPKLIEEALVALQSDPKNLKLLEGLGEYAKNDRHERQTANYTTRVFKNLGFLFLSLGLLASAGLSLLYFELLGTFAVLPLILSAYIISVFILASAITSLVLFSAFLIGRWVVNLIKASNREPANIKVLENHLTLLIDESKTKKADEDPVKGQLKDGMEELQVGEKLASAPPLPPSSLYPSLRFYKDSIPTDQDTACYAHDNPRAYRY